MARLIDADAMMKHLENLLCGDCNTPRKEGWCDVCDYAFLMNEMKKEPTVEPKHGYWKGKPIAGYSTVRCSECGEAFMENNGKWNYCPNCGAKMENANG